MNQKAAGFLCLFLALPSLVAAQSAVENEIEERIKASYAFTAENLADNPEETSVHGSLAFWSSGGLLQEVSRSDAPEMYAFFNLVPKHIQVVPLAEGVAMAQFYCGRVLSTEEWESGCPLPDPRDPGVCPGRGGVADPWCTLLPRRWWVRDPRYGGEITGWLGRRRQAEKHRARREQYVQRSGSCSHP